jgi:hypothetical protein
MIANIININLLKQFIVDHPEVRVSVGDMFVYRLTQLSGSNQYDLYNLLVNRYGMNINLNKVSFRCKTFKKINLLTL